MSVLACDRRGCDNIMCDRLSDDYGYLCEECFEELIASQTRRIGVFMCTPPDRHQLLEIPRESYEAIFVWRHQ